MVHFIAHELNFSFAKGRLYHVFFDLKKITFTHNLLQNSTKPISEHYVCI